MYLLIRHNHNLGKMFSAPLHAVKGRGWDLGHRDPAAAVRGGRGLNGAWSALMWVSGKCKGQRGRGKIFLFFKVYFPMCWGVYGCWVWRFQLNMMDQTSWKINTRSQRRTLTHSLYCAWSNSLHQLCMCVQGHRHMNTLNYHRCSPCSNTPAPLTLTIL